MCIMNMNIYIDYLFCKVLTFSPISMGAIYPLCGFYNFGINAKPGSHAASLLLFLYTLKSFHFTFLVIHQNQETLQGHKTVSFPREFIYQLLQPPLAHTVVFNADWMLAK